MTEQEETLQAAVGYISCPTRGKNYTYQIIKQTAKWNYRLIITWNMTPIRDARNNKFALPNGNGLSINSRRNTF